mmetsp:Transcript_114241/g.323039  ORF Transcript_114241/g.323039 Transcript_114241/m.323039 type:complete len:126 (+) Transcript_114241:39-416(+)
MHSSVTIAAIGRAPRQNDKTERAGGLFKEVVFATAALEVPQSLEEWDDCIAEVNALENQTFHRSGFPPHQRVFGNNPRVPDSTLSDDAMNDITIDGNTEFARASGWRTAARQVSAILLRCSSAMQ